MPRRSPIELSKLDIQNVVADIETIRQDNPQRYEFEQLSWICHFDQEAGEVAGVLDVPEDPWWARGHVPAQPLMPGVLMLESAAQLCSWAVHQIYKAEKEERIFGFGGIDKVKFRSTIFPPSKMVIVGKAVDVRTRRAIFDTAGYDETLSRAIFQAQITGMWVGL